MGKEYDHGMWLATCKSPSVADHVQGTVLFAANLAFLGIDSVDTGHIAVKTFSFLSIVTAVNAIVTSFAFVRHFKLKDMGNMSDAVRPSAFAWAFVPL